MIRWDDDSSEMMMTVAFFPETKEILDNIRDIRPHTNNEKATHII